MNPEGLPSSPRWSLVWLIAALLTSAIATALGFVNDLLGLALLILASVVVAVLAVALTVAGFLSAWRLRAEPWAASPAALSPPVAVALAFMLVGPTIDLTNTALTRATLAYNRSAYLEIVRRIEAGEIAKQPLSSTALGVDFTIDAGPPLRVAFPYGSGLVDNWTALVYDPTAEILNAAQAWHKDAPENVLKIKKLFGGDVAGCRHVDGAFYACGFT